MAAFGTLKTSVEDAFCKRVRLWIVDEAPRSSAWAAVANVPDMRLTILRRHWMEVAVNVPPSFCDKSDVLHHSRAEGKGDLYAVGMGITIGPSTSNLSCGNRQCDSYRPPGDGCGSNGPA